MAVLENIRVKLGVFITVLIAISLLSFIIDPSTLSSTIQNASADNKVGTMNGKKITYQDFYTKVEQNTNLFEQIYGQSFASEEQHSQVRDFTWQTYLDQYVFEPKAKDAGLIVGDQEMYDLTQGSNISPVLSSQQMFLDQNGVFSREALAQFVQNIDYDATGTYSAYWNYLRDQIYKQQLYNKYYSLLSASTVYSPLQTSRAIAENNLTSDVDFFMLAVGYAPDSTIQVSNQEIEAYYKKHKEQLKQFANRDIEYVMYEVVPSEADITDQQSKFASLVTEFAESDNLKNFISLNSDGRWSDIYYSKNDLASIPEFQSFVFPEKGAASAELVSPTREVDNTLSAARIVDRKMVPDSVRVFYSMFDLASATQADSVAAVLNNKGEYEGLSEMGWMTMAANEANGLSDLNAAFDIPVGNAAAIRMPNLQAILVAKVEEATKPIEKVSLAILTKNITASDETFRDYLMQATSLADKADGKYEAFAAAVKEDNLPVIPANHIVEATRTIGLVDNARELVTWVFDAKQGDVSDVITVDNKYYFVAAVTAVRKEGYIDINDVRDDIYNTLAIKKMATVAAEEMKAKTQGLTSLEAMAEACGATVSHQSGISFGSQSTALDPSFIGAIAAAPKGEICGPVEGQIGVYMFQVNDNVTGAYFTESDAALRAQQDAQYRQQIIGSVFESEAEVKDNRARFY